MEINHLGGLEGFEEIDIELYLVSSATHKGLDELMQRVSREIADP